MPRPAKTSAACARKWCRIPAPAPCASTYSWRASCGRTSKPSSVFPKAHIEPLQDVYQIGLGLEHRQNRIVFELPHALQRIGDREVAVVKLGVDLVPFDWHRHRRTRGRTHTVGRDHQLAGAVLEGVDVD